MSDADDALTDLTAGLTPLLGDETIATEAPLPTSSPPSALRLVAQGAPGRTPALARLVIGTSHRRIYVLRAGDEVRCGRKKPTREDRAPNHLVLRLLPCRSKEEDPDNWKSTLAISSTHMAFIKCHDGLRLLDNSRNGTMLNGKPLQKGLPSPLTEEFQVMVGGVLRLRGQLVVSQEDEVMHIEGDVLLPLDQPIAPDVALPYKLDACVLDRVANAADDTYVLLYRRVAIGSAPECPIQVEGAGVAPVHAHLLRHRGVLLLMAAPDGEGATVVDGRPLGPGVAVPLTPGSSVQLGETTIGVAESRPADLVTPPEA